MGSKGEEANRSGEEQASRETSATEPTNRKLWIAALLLLLFGLALSGELVRLHFAVTSDPAHHSYCSVNSTVNCDAVSLSKYAVFFGVPVAIWGVFGYAAMAAVTVLGLRWRSLAPAALHATLTGFALVVTVVLAAISHFLIHAWCLLCVGTYVVNFALAALSYSILSKAGWVASYRALIEYCTTERGRTLAVSGATGGIALALILVYPPPQAASILMAQKPEASTSAPASSVQPIPPLPSGAHIERGVTSEGLPWIGAENPVVTITEFFDYECAHCRVAFRGLHDVLELNPDRMRLVARHFPLDQACNRSIRKQVYEHSCLYAKLANCARLQERFWEAHDYLFEHSGELVDPMTFAAALNLDKKEFKACLKRDDPALNRDIEAGIALDLHGTPVFVVDGQVYMQGLPPSIAEKLRHHVNWR